jgi:quercetin dioxygenase-like cupin family protein
MSSPEQTRRGETAPRGSFRTWNGREPYEIFDGVRLHAIGGEQVLLCRVVYEPGKRVLEHSHDHTEQVMFILDGSVEVTVEEETQTMGPGDVAVINRGVPHALYSAGGVTFMEALAPVPLDHVPDKGLDLVLGPDDGATHVER